jgi:hypothetical protein
LIGSVTTDGGQEVFGVTRNLLRFHRSDEVKVDIPVERVIILLVWHVMNGDHKGFKASSFPVDGGGLPRAAATNYPPVHDLSEISPVWGLEAAEASRWSAGSSP